MAETTKAATILELGEESGFQIPVALKKVRSKSDVTLDSASLDGNPVKEIKTDLATGEKLEPHEIQKGVFRIKPNKQKRETWSDFQPISPVDLDAIAAATNIDHFVIDHFVPLKEVPFERVTDAYFLAPVEGMTPKPLVLLARTLRKTKKAGVLKIVRATRQHLAVVYEKDGGLILNTLAFANDCGALREAREALQAMPVKIAPGEQELAVTLVETLSADAAIIDSFEDDMVALRADLVERALAGKPVEAPTRRKRVEAPDDGLEDRLRASLARHKGSPSGRRAAVPA